MLDRNSYYKYLAEQPVGSCLFCDPEKQEVIKIGKDWIWANSMSPVWRYHTMLIPKRHITDIAELDYQEFKEMNELISEALFAYRRTGLRDGDGKLFDKYEFLWRLRDSYIDSLTGVEKPSHFHINMYPFKDHHTDAVRDKQAHLYDFRQVLRNE